MARNFEIRPLTKDCIEQSMEFLRENFFPYEPCAVAIDLCPLGYRIPALEEQITAIICKGHSLAAYKSGSKEMVGIIVLDSKVKGIEDDVKQHSPSSGFPKKFVKLDRFFTDLTTDYGKSSGFEKLSANKILDIFIVCTSPKAGRQGIGSALVSESLNLANSKGFEGVQCMALSLYTQKICQKLGFQETFSITYGDYSQKGEKLFARADMGPHKNGVLFVRRL